MILKPVSGTELVDQSGGFDSLRIRGMKLSPSNTRVKRQIRPYTTDLTGNHRFRTTNVTHGPRPQSMNAKLSRECESRLKTPYQTRPHPVDITFEKDDSKVKPPKKRSETPTMISPRKVKEVKIGEEIISESKNADDNLTADETKREQPSSDAPEEKDNDQVDSSQSECFQETSQEVSGAVKKEPLYNGVSSVTVLSRNSELQRRPSKSPRHLRCGPKKKPYFVNSPDIPAAASLTSDKSQNEKKDSCANTDYRKTADNLRHLGNTSRNRGQSEKDLIAQVQKIDDGKGKITNSLNAIYQGYVSKCKPHHRKLSIMQAHEILQRESKFQSKYGRRPDSSIQEKESFVEEKTDEKTASSEGPAIQAKIVRREKQPQKYFKASGMSGLTLKEDHKDLILHASQCRWMKNEILESGLLNRERESSANKNPDENNRSTSASNDAKDERLSAQEDSLKRQKQKELTEEVEREKQRIERELLDSERVKLIEQYLDDVYARYGVNTTTLQLDNKACEKERMSHSKVQKRQGQIYSWLPRKKNQRSFSPGVSNKTPSILHNSNQSSQTFSIGHVSKKVEFKEKQPSNGDSNNNKVRYFNDWSKTAFINYVNSEGEFKVDEANQDLSNKLKDGGYWLKRHLSGVVMKSNTKQVAGGTPAKT